MRLTGASRRRRTRPSRGSRRAGRPPREGPTGAVRDRGDEPRGGADRTREKAVTAGRGLDASLPCAGAEGAPHRPSARGPTACYGGFRMSSILAGCLCEIARRVPEPKGTRRGSRRRRDRTRHRRAVERHDDTRRRETRDGRRAGAHDAPGPRRPPSLGALGSGESARRRGFGAPSIGRNAEIQADTRPSLPHRRGPADARPIGPETA